MALLEAMAAGVPVVATRVGGIPDVVTDGSNGLLVESRDTAALARAIAALLDEPGERTRLGRAARRRVAESFSVEAVLPQVEQLWSAHAAYAKRTSEAGAAFP